MRNPDTVGYEGAANLLAGFRVAAEPASRGKGVLVVLNDQINAAREVTKTDAHRLDTFTSRDYGVIGVVDEDRVVYYRSSLKRHTAATEFDITHINDLPRVDVVMVYQGAGGDVIKALVDLGAKGIVVAGAGAGATSGTQGEGLRYAAEKGVVVVMSTRTGSGRIPARRGAVTGTRGAFQQRISAEDLAPVKARILLMLALATTKDAAAIQRMFTEYLAAAAPGSMKAELVLAPRPPPGQPHGSWYDRRAYDDQDGCHDRHQTVGRRSQRHHPSSISGLLRRLRSGAAAFDRRVPRLGRVARAQSAEAPRLLSPSQRPA